MLPTSCILTRGLSLYKDFIGQLGQQSHISERHVQQWQAYQSAVQVATETQTLDAQTASTVSAIIDNVSNVVKAMAVLEDLRENEIAGLTDRIQEVVLSNPTGECHARDPLMKAERAMKRSGRDETHEHHRTAKRTCRPPTTKYHPSPSPTPSLSPPPLRRSKSTTTAKSLTSLKSTTKPPPPSQPSHDPVRQFFLTHLSNPYPSPTEKTTLCKAANITRRKLESDLTNWRRRSDWTDMMNTYCGGDKGAMGRMIDAIERGEERDEGLLERFGRMKMYLEKKDEQAGEWVLQVGSVFLSSFALYWFINLGVLDVVSVMVLVDWWSKYMLTSSWQKWSKVVESTNSALPNLPTPNPNPTDPPYTPGPPKSPTTSRSRNETPGRGIGRNRPNPILHLSPKTKPRRKTRTTLRTRVKTRLMIMLKANSRASTPRRTQRVNQSMNPLWRSTIDKPTPNPPSESPTRPSQTPRPKKGKAKPSLLLHSLLLLLPLRSNRFRIAISLLSLPLARTSLLVQVSVDLRPLALLLICTPGPCIILGGLLPSTLSPSTQNTPPSLTPSPTHRYQLVGITPPPPPLHRERGISPIPPLRIPTLLLPRFAVYRPAPVGRHILRSVLRCIMGPTSLSILSCSTFPRPPKGQVRRRASPEHPGRGSTTPSPTRTPERVGWKDMRPTILGIKSSDSILGPLLLRLRINRDHSLPPFFRVLERYLPILRISRRS